MPSNFYDWTYGTISKAISIAQDAQVMREHPDGSPCYAKKVETCPVFAKERKKDDADTLTDSESTEKRHLSELLNQTLSQIQTKVPECEGISYSELENAYEDIIESIENGGSGDEIIIKDSKKARDDVFAMHKDAMYQSFNLSDGDETHPDGGWGVTFHTTSAEQNMSSDEYDRNVALFSKIFNANPQVGVYEGSCEISYECKSLPIAAAGMVACEQKAIFGYMMQKNGKDYGIDILNRTFDQNINNLEYAKE